MLRRHPGRLAPMVGLLLWAAVSAVHAVIFHDTGEAAHNTTAPSGPLAGSGWQLQGTWGNFLGTPISPNHFIAAAHVGGSIGGAFILEGVTYPTVEFFDDPETDLRIWRVCGTFPAFANLYAGTNETGREMMVFGRGTRRGEPVVVSEPADSGLRGWKWGVYDGVQRWGRNVVSGLANGDGLPGDAGVGEVLVADFNADGISDECHLSAGDSSGGVFIDDGSGWKLAGINLGVDGPYNDQESGEGFNAAIFDERGLYKRDDELWVLIPDLPLPQPGSFYATRISSRLDWIQSVLALVDPDGDRPVLQAGPTVNGPFVDRQGSAVDLQSRTVSLPQPSGPEFYRLRACELLQITSIEVREGLVVIRYDPGPVAD